MRNVHKREIANFLEANGYDIVAFNVTESTDTFQISYKYSGLHFKFFCDRHYRDAYTFLYYRYNIDASVIEFQKTCSWQDAFTSFVSWVKNELDAYIEDQALNDPFKKRDDSSTFALLNIQVDEDDNPFTVGEQAVLKKEIIKLQLHIESSFQLQQIQLTKIQTVLEDLSRSVETERKMTWKKLFTKGMWEIAKTIAIDKLSEGFKGVIDFFNSNYPLLPPQTFMH